MNSDEILKAELAAVAECERLREETRGSGFALANRVVIKRLNGRSRVD